MRCAAMPLTVALVAVAFGCDDGPAVPETEALAHVVRVSSPGTAKDPSAVLDPSGTLVVAWVEDDLGASTVRVSREGAARWTSLPDPQPFADSATEPRLAVAPDGQLFVVWVSSRLRSAVRAARFEGLSWAPLDGLDVSPGTARSVAPAVAVGADGNPVVAWWSISASMTTLPVMRWAGSAWEDLGSPAGSALPDETRGPPALATTTAGALAIAWAQAETRGTSIRVRTFSGGDWLPPPGAVDDLVFLESGDRGFVSLAVDAAGNPTIAWVELAASEGEVYLARWDGASWTEVGRSASGGGVSRTNGPSTSPSVALDADAAPWVAWTEGLAGGTGVRLDRFDGIQWAKSPGFNPASDLVSGMFPSSRDPRLVIGADGHACVVWVATLGGAAVPDGGSAPPDGGPAPPDAGSTAPDAGASTADGGLAPEDGGLPAADAGSPATDGGGLPADAGAAGLDAGTTDLDGGTAGGSAQTVVVARCSR